MTTPDGEPVIERFPPTSGRITGVIGVIAGVVVLVLGLAARSTDTALGVALLGGLGSVLAWASLLRPAVWATTDDLVLRGMFQTDTIPLAAVERVAITQVLSVTAGGKRYVSPAIGHSTRDVARARRRPGGLERQTMDALQAATEATGARGAHQGYVESRIDHLVDEARQRAGIRRGSPEQAALAAGVRRAWAWPELAGALAFALAFVVWLVL